MFNIQDILRKNIKCLRPYSSARDEYSGASAIFLDANENPYEQGVNRYPDPRQWMLKQKISKLKNVPAEQIFLGNGSDEAIDLLFRAVCESGIDNVIIPHPTYGMYQVCADINNISVQKVSLTKDWHLDVEAILSAINDQTKMIFICTPNNPTSNVFAKQDVLKILDNFQSGLVVIDEAYIDFCDDQSYSDLLKKYPQLVVLQTFSKAWGMAGIRLGMAFSNTPINDILTSIKFPYNINVLTIDYAMKALDNLAQKDAWVGEILSERKRVKEGLMSFEMVEKVYESDANFLMVKVKNPKALYANLVAQNIVVRDRSNVNLCDGCLRFTIGTPVENKLLLGTLKQYDLKV